MRLARAINADMIDKIQLILQIIADLNAAINTALAAADDARTTATNKENVAENRYDTLGLEAAYLAHGQSERVMQLNAALEAFENLIVEPNNHSVVMIGSLVTLLDDSNAQRDVFIGPTAGGQVINFASMQITIITQQSPLGCALSGATCEDEISAEIAGKRVNYTITSLC